MEVFLTRILSWLIRPSLDLTNTALPNWKGVFPQLLLLRGLVVSLGECCVGNHEGKKRRWISRKVVILNCLLIVHPDPCKKNDPKLTVCMFFTRRGDSPPTSYLEETQLSCGSLCKIVCDVRLGIVASCKMHYVQSVCSHISFSNNT